MHKRKINELLGFTGSLNIPESIAIIEMGAFFNCLGFTGTLSLPNGLTKIEKDTFYNCNGFTGLVFGNNLYSIMNAAFYNCSAIEGKVVFPMVLNYMEEEAFYKCDKVKAFRFPQTTPIGHFKNMLPSAATVEVPSSAVATYKSTNGWRDYNIVGY